LKRDAKTKKEQEKRLEKIVVLIECFDSIRKGQLHAQSKLVKELSSFEGCRAELRYVKKDFQKAATVIKSGKQKRLNAIIKINNIVQLICLQYFMVTVGLSLMIRLQPGVFEKLGIARVLFTFPVMFLMFTLAVFFLIMQRYVKKKIKTFTDSRANPQARDRRLKEMTQKFINMLGKELVWCEEDPKKFRFRIYHKDYEGIHIIKRPSATSDHYTAIVSVEERNRE
jgi:hypothetical protein